MQPQIGLAPGDMYDDAYNNWKGDQAKLSQRLNSTAFKSTMFATRPGFLAPGPYTSSVMMPGQYPMGGYPGGMMPGMMPQPYGMGMGMGGMPGYGQPCMQPMYGAPMGMPMGMGYPQQMGMGMGMGMGMMGMGMGMMPSQLIRPGGDTLVSAGALPGALPTVSTGSALLGHPF